MYKTEFSSEFSIMFSLTVDCEPRKFLGQNGDTCQKCPIGTKPKKYAVNLRYFFSDKPYSRLIRNCVFGPQIII